MPEDRAPLSLPADIAEKVKAIGVKSTLSADRDAWRATAGGTLPSDSLKLEESDRLSDSVELTRIIQPNPADGKPVVAGVVIARYSEEGKDKFVNNHVFLDNPQSKILFTNDAIRVPHPFQLLEGMTEERLHEGPRKQLDISVHCPHNGSCHADFRNVQSDNHTWVSFSGDGLSELAIGSNTRHLVVTELGAGNPDPEKKLSIIVPASLMIDPRGISGATPENKAKEEIFLRTHIDDEQTASVFVRHERRNVDLVLTAKDAVGKTISSTVPLKDENGMIADDLSIEELKKKVAETAQSLLDKAGNAKPKRQEAQPAR
jgi:hypothetical protein